VRHIRFAVIINAIFHGDARNTFLVFVCGAGLPTSAWKVDFGLGNMTFYGVLVTDAFDVRCVR
jgi:hypothetical protein